MEENRKYSNNKEEIYQQLKKEIPFILDASYPLVSNLANFSALLNQALMNLNWVGFYLYKKDCLYLGPFQGLPACTRIKMGKGVCGTALQEKMTMVVADVHQFPGHIACDSASNSEIVVPILSKNQYYGVLDLDSFSFSNFDDIDKKYLEEFVALYLLPLFQDQYDETENY